MAADPRQRFEPCAELEAQHSIVSSETSELPIQRLDRFEAQNTG